MHRRLCDRSEKSARYVAYVDNKQKGRQHWNVWSFNSRTTKWKVNSRVTAVEVRWQRVTLLVWKASLPTRTKLAYYPTSWSNFRIVGIIRFRQRQDPSRDLSKRKSAAISTVQCFTIQLLTHCSRRCRQAIIIGRCSMKSRSLSRPALHRMFTVSCHNN